MDTPGYWDVKLKLDFFQAHKALIQGGLGDRKRAPLSHSPAWVCDTACTGAPVDHLQIGHLLIATLLLASES